MENLNIDYAKELKAHTWWEKSASMIITKSPVQNSKP